MSDTRRSVRLSPAQAEHLARATYLPMRLRDAVSEAMERQDSGRIEVDREVADMLQPVFTDRLAEVGFDAAYELTEEGRILEHMIDAFGGEPRNE